MNNTEIDYIFNKKNINYNSELYNYFILWLVFSYLKYINIF